MNCSTKYVAMDVHQATTVATVRSETGRILARGIVDTEKEALLEFFGGMRGAIHVAFEEGTQAQWLHDLLEPHVHRVVVCDRRGERKQGNKGDKMPISCRSGCDVASYARSITAALSAARSRS